MDRPAILGGDPVTRKSIPFTRIYISDEEIKAVKDVLRSRIFVNGPYTEELEREFAKYIGAKHAIAVSNGTDALFLSYIALGIGYGDRVATTPITFIATVSTIIHVGSVPVFCDVDVDSNLNPCEIPTRTEGLKAIVPVHLYGKPARMDEVVRIARENELYVIEDAAQAHGAVFAGKKVGLWGDVATFSFYPSKIIPAAGWGGIIVTNNDEIAERLRLLRAHGELRVLEGAKGAYEYIRLGYNMRISEIEAAVALCQLGRIERYIGERRRIARIFNEELSKLPGIVTPTEDPGMRHVYYIYSILVDPSEIGWDRDSFVEALNREGVDARRGYHTPIYKTQLFRRINDPRINHLARIQKYPDYSKIYLENAEAVARRTVWLPIFPGMGDDEVEAVLRSVKKLVEWGRRRRKGQ